MHLTASQKLIKIFRKASEITAILAIAIGLITFIGWILDIPILKSFHPAFSAMKTNAAICVMLLGISILFLQHKRTSKIKLTGKTIAGLVLLICILTLAEYIFNIDFRIDQLLFIEKEHVFTYAPNRMSAIAAIIFALSSMYLLLLDLQNKATEFIRIISLCVAGFLSLVGIINYIYGTPLFFLDFMHSTNIALNATIAAMFISSALFFIRPDKGYFSIFVSSGTAGMGLRILMFGAPILIFLIDIIIIAGTKFGFYDDKYSSSIHYGLLLFVLLFIITRISWFLEKTDSEKNLLIKELNKNEKSLQLRNEEIQAQNEEIQATNEELYDVNLKLKNSNDELSLLKENLETIITERTVEVSKKNILLLSNKKQLIEAQNIAGMGYYVLNIKNNTWTSSELLNTILGIDEQYIKTVESWNNLIPEDDRKYMLDYFLNDVLNKKETFDREYRIIRPMDQREIWVHGRGKLELNLQGEPVLMIGTIRDITKRKLIEITLHEKNKEIEAQNDEYISLNEEYISLNEELKNRNEEYVILNSELSLAKNKAEESELFNSIVLDLYKKSEIINIDGIINLCLEKAIELTKSEIGFFHLINPDEDIVSLKVWSSKTMHICNIPAKDTHYPISKAGVWVDCIKERKPIIHNDYSNLPHKNGLPLGHAPIIRELTIPLFEGENIVAILGVGNKITNYNDTDIETLTNFSLNYWNIIRRKKTEFELLEAKDKAEESDRLKSAFLANMSHEIRTPMNGILGFSEMLLKPHLAKEKQKQYVDIINTCGNQLMSIINDLIDISKIEANLIKIEHKELHLNELMCDVLSMFKNKPVKSNLAMRFIPGLDDNACLISTDGVRLTQVISNLLNNALKFTKQGHINYGYTVRAIEGDDKKSELLFFVEDTGIGIPQDKFNLIFERFIQAETTTAQYYGGTGLGLAISKSFINLLGGNIWLESEINKGTTFYFTIPFISAKNNTNNSVADNLNSINKLSGITILVAEDEDNNFIYLEELLEEYQINCLRANNGIEAIESIVKHKNIQLVLMDLKMPLMDGYRATEEIKRINPKLPVIALTAYAQSGDREKALVHGCDEYISKPVNVAQLISCMTKFIHQV